MPEGKIKFWNAKRGFGFIRCDDGTNVFAHINAVADETIEQLNAGQRVRFEQGVSKKTGRPQAVNVVLLAKD